MESAEIVTSTNVIKSRIYEVRGRRVMIDSDLAEMYGVETKNLKRAVRNNIERFPDDFMFELTKEEYDSLRCNIFTIKITDQIELINDAIARLQIEVDEKRKEPKRKPIGFKPCKEI